MSGIIWGTAVLGLCVLAVAASLLVGRYPVGFGGTLGMLFGNVPCVDTHFTPVDQTVPTAIRLPHIWCGVFVGAGLAASGAGYQTMFRDPLVSPDILGVGRRGIRWSVGAAAAPAVWQLDSMAFADGLIAETCR
jgi:iron complex transport system permease protein